MAEDGAGAGAGKVSAPSLPLVGRYVPVTTVPLAGMLPAAPSSNVRVPLTAKPPALATSDMSTRFCPAGPTSSTSMSWAIGWFTALRVTLTSEMVPLRPLTVIGDGYGDPGPCWSADPVAGTAMGVVLLTVSVSAAAGAAPDHRIDTNASTMPATIATTRARPRAPPRLAGQVTSWAGLRPPAHRTPIVSGTLPRAAKPVEPYYLPHRADSGR